MKGSIISAAEGDVDAARQAKTMAQLLLEHHRPSTSNGNGSARSSSKATWPPVSHQQHRKCVVLV